MRSRACLADWGALFLTAIAYRDGILAADTSDFTGAVRTGSVKKIVRRSDGALAAASGNATVCAAFLRLFEGSVGLDLASLEFRPQLKPEDQFTALIVNADGALWYIDDSGWCAMDAEFAAIGCAHDMLIGAMAAGASAAEAVAIAVKYHGYCGGEVQVECLPVAHLDALCS